MQNLKTIMSVVLFILLLFTASIPSFSQKKTDNTKLIYIPVYSSIYHGDRQKEINLAVTLCIRNVDSSSTITIYSVDYYNSSGNLIRNYLDSPKVLKPFETMNIVVKKSDTHGGSSAGFTVKWGADGNANDLLAEAVMIGTYPQGISFTTRGINIKK